MCDSNINSFHNYKCSVFGFHPLVCENRRFSIRQRCDNNISLNAINDTHTCYFFVSNTANVGIIWAAFVKYVKYLHRLLQVRDMVCIFVVQDLAHLQ